jgi:Flp pilus assembly protein TadB
MSGYEEVTANMKEVAKKSLRYSRLSTLLDRLVIALFVSAGLATVAYVLSHGVYWQLLVAGIALAVASYVADRLRDNYYRKMLKETQQLEKLVYMLALAIKIDGLVAKLEKEIDELERRLQATD